MNKRITTLTGPSCAGKSTLEAMMVERGCMKAVSVTTRQPRPHEVDGVDYYFLSEEKFATLAECGMFVESVQFGEHKYGVTAAEISRLFARGDHVVLVCEPVGAKQISKWCALRPGIELVSVFVDNSRSVTDERFLKRFGDVVMSQQWERGGSHQAALLKSYARRLTIMTTVEYGWRLEAHGDAKPGSGGIPHRRFRYDLLVEHFDETNAVAVADSLIESMSVAL